MFGLFVRIGRKTASYSRGRVNDRAFAALDDRTLQDIGVDRGRIGGASRHGADRRERYDPL